MASITVSRRILPRLRMWVREAAWFQDGLTTVRDESAAKEALVLGVHEMHGNESKMGPTWGNMGAALLEWNNGFGIGVRSVDANGFPTCVQLLFCSLRGPMSTQLCRLSTLVELDLSGNHIMTLPDSIGNLTNLTHLQLHWNQLTTLPDSIEKLTNLTILDLSKNHLTQLPDFVLNMTNLKQLHMSDNQLTTIPDSISNLTNLTNLHLFNNWFSEREKLHIRNILRRRIIVYYL